MPTLLGLLERAKLNYWISYVYLEFWTMNKVLNTNNSEDIL
jgi:hypothetical protein